MADSIFAKKTQKDVDELEKIVLNEEASREDLNSTVFSLEHEIQFHGKLYQMARNITLQRFQVLLLPVFEYFYDQKKAGDTYIVKNPITHRNLLDNLKVGTPDTFRTAMRQHLDPPFSKIL